MGLSRFEFFSSLLICHLNVVSDANRRTLENSQISRAVLDLIQMLLPVSSALMVMQSSWMTLGLATELWTELLERTPASSPMRSILEHRAVEALNDPNFIMGNLLDPRFRGKCLTPQQVAKAFEAYPQHINDLQQYLAYSGPFLLKMECVDPTLWWKAGVQCGYPPDLVDLGMKLASCRPTSASQMCFRRPSTIFVPVWENFHFGAEGAKQKITNENCWNF